MVDPAALPRPPADLVDELDPSRRQAVLQTDVLAAARAVLLVVDETPPFSSTVRERSRWLAFARSLLATQEGDEADVLGVRLFVSIARTAFAARETSPALIASRQALDLARDVGDVESVLRIHAGRVAFQAVGARAEATDEIAEMQGVLAAHVGSDLPASVDVEVRLARLAWAGARGDLVAMRSSLANVGRLELPKTDWLHFLAWASQSALAQLMIRSGQRTHAVRALIEAARIADELDAHAELANLQGTVAGIAVQAGDFESAVSHAESALAAASLAGAPHGQPDPWLGMPYDLAACKDAAGAIRIMAESAVDAQTVSDPDAFLQSVTSMVAFYLADDRAVEALDALGEAVAAARDNGHQTAARLLREVSEHLLGDLGVLRN